jgi:hypothetical protein
MPGIPWRSLVHLGSAWRDLFFFRLAHVAFPPGSIGGRVARVDSGDNIRTLAHATVPDTRGPGPCRDLDQRTTLWVMTTVIALFALIPLALVSVAVAWWYRRRDDEPEWRR